MTHLLRRLEGERALSWLVAIAVLFCARAFWLPLEMDDHWLPQNYARGPLRMLGAIAPSDIPAAKASGDLSWWANERLSMQFFRPLSSLSHWIDQTLWPQAVWAMHASNVLVYVLLVAAAAACYRRLQRDAADALPLAAALAGLLFTVDDAHAASVGWISGRNSLLSAAFAMAAFYAYLRRSWLGPLALALGLASGEGALQASAYLLAHALILDQRPWRARALGLGPYAAVLLLWGSFYVAQGYGVHNSDWYRSPSAASLLAGLWDLPLWLGSALIASLATPTLLFDSPATRVIWLVALALAAPPLIAAIRHRPLARFYALGMLLCCAPLLFTRPQDRLLLCASFGAAGWLGTCLALRPSLAGYARGAATALGVLHLGLSPLLYPVQLGQAEPIERSAHALAAEMHAASDRSQTILVQLPFDILHNLARSQLRAAGASVPAHSHVLYAGSSELQVQRTDARTLLVHARRGWFADSYERLFVTLDPGFTVQQRWQLPGMQVEVVHVDAHRAPDVVRFVFATPLEDPARRWLHWRGQYPAVWEVPAIGTSVSLPALSPLRSLTPRAQTPAHAGLPLTSRAHDDRE